MTTLNDTTYIQNVYTIKRSFHYRHTRATNIILYIGTYNVLTDQNGEQKHNIIKYNIILIAITVRFTQLVRFY